MGRRGPQTGSITMRAPKRRDVRPHSSVRAAEIREGVPAYWDLILRLRPDGHPFHWADPLDPERAAAWRTWRERIRRRWPHSWSCGERPAAWFDFDAPALAAKADLTDGVRRRLRSMSPQELVYWIDVDAAERADIEDHWNRGIEHTGHSNPDADRRTLRKIAGEQWAVPGWWFDRSQTNSVRAPRPTATPGAAEI